MSLVSKAVDLMIGADLRGTAGGMRVERLLEAFGDLQKRRPNARLALAIKRSRTDYFSVSNWIGTADLWESIDFRPYFDVCRDFPVRKRDCAAWIDDRTPEGALTADGLLQDVDGSSQKTALFITGFHPAKPEGATALMRQWLSHLRGAGYQIDLLYYSIDKGSVPPEFGALGGWEHDRLIEVPVATPLVGMNKAGLNVHVDDWTGPELLDAVDALVDKTCYDVAIANYAFSSAVFERIPAYTHRILLTHDLFTDRNRRMQADGFSRATWVSLDRAGEAQACARADTVIALQDFEADEFRKLAGDTDVQVVGPVPKAVPRLATPRLGRLRVGYLGSGNRVNEVSVANLLSYWAKSDNLRQNAALFLGGGLCDTLANFVPRDVLQKVDPFLMGRVEDLQDFFKECDVFINPELGGTGIKIKSLEAMAYGVPLITTAAGGIGIGSASRFHNAPDNAALVGILEEIATESDLVRAASQATISAWDGYVGRHRGALEVLLGPAMAIGATPSPAPHHAMKASTHLRRQSGKVSLLFHPDGSPVAPLRRLLFQKNGTPRTVFRRIVLKKSGRPRTAFQEWMMQIHKLG